jgi:cytochrome c peroxidase
MHGGIAFVCSALLMMAAVCLTGAMSVAHAQSSSAAEERLRASLLEALKENRIRRPEDLIPFYRRDLVIPFRRQPEADTEAAIALGRKLFFDVRLSEHGDLSCASCHLPEKYWVDGLPQSTEGNRRRSMTLFNLAWDSVFTWHGRAGTLMSQSILAMTAPKGMGANMLQTASRIEKIPEYQEMARRAFPSVRGGVSPDVIAAAIEYYVASRISGTSPFDRWVDGETGALGPRARRGFLAFHTKANCGQCHNLWRFSDSRRYDIGLKEPPGSDREPLYKAVGLRNIALRPPYMHDGSMKSLDEVLAFYMRGGDVARPTKSALIKPLPLTLDDQADILLFLKSLSDPKPPQP